MADDIDLSAFKALLALDCKKLEIAPNDHTFKEIQAFIGTLNQHKKTRIELACTDRTIEKPAYLYVDYGVDQHLKNLEATLKKQGLTSAQRAEVNAQRDVRIEEIRNEFEVVIKQHLTTQPAPGAPPAATTSGFQFFRGILGSSRTQNDAGSKPSGTNLAGLLRTKVKDLPETSIDYHVPISIRDRRDPTTNR